uniref:SFRICE_015262 n=1 Tax=Spodoptera frugiperda TaxID=7108 RepID=A0A2H1VB25_SPOFR
MSKLSFRARALDASKPMPIYLAEELPDLPDYSAINRAVPQMPSGMEKEEESLARVDDLGTPRREYLRPILAMYIELTKLWGFHGSAVESESEEIPSTTDGSTEVWDFQQESKPYKNANFIAGLFELPVNKGCQKLYTWRSGSKSQ